MEDFFKEEKDLHVYWISDKGTLYHYIFKPDDYSLSRHLRRTTYTIRANIAFTQSEQIYHCPVNDLNVFRNGKIFSFDITDNAEAMKVIRRYYDDKIAALNIQMDKLRAIRNTLG